MESRNIKSFYLLFGCLLIVAVLVFVGIRYDFKLFTSTTPSATASFYNVYFGDTHGHTKMSDGGCQTDNPADFYVYARDVLDLDFAMMSDHAGMISDSEWLTVQNLASSFYDPGNFTTFVGFEWTSGTYGHKNVYFPGTNLPDAPWQTNDTNYDTPQELWAAAKQYGAITVAHHPQSSFPQETDWAYRDDESQPIVEVYSKHGNSEYDGAQPELSNPAIEGDHSVQEALALGHKLGIWASTDSHSGWSGYLAPNDPAGVACLLTIPYRGGWAGVWATENTREALWDAFINHRVFGTTGEKIVLLFKMDERFMGSTYTTLDDPNIRIEVNGTSPLQTVEIVRNNDTIYTYTGTGETSAVIDYTDSGVPVGDYYYYVRVTEDNRNPGEDDEPERAWSSPIWVTVTGLPQGDGYCDGSIGENCNTQPADCITGEFAICGDGVCHGSAFGETCNTCSSDCIGGSTPGGTCSACVRRICNNICNLREDSTCADCNPGISYCCGDGACQGDENTSNCPIDCNGSVPNLYVYCCGDGVCEGDENVSNCPYDCGL